MKPTPPDSPIHIQHSPLEAIQLPPVLRLIVSFLLGVVRVLRRWRYPMKTEGDFATMRFADKLYWLHKLDRPITLAERGEGIEEELQRSRDQALALPADFHPEREFTLSAVGDLIQHPLLETPMETSPMASIAGKLFDADIIFGNLESPLTNQTQSDITFDEKEAPSLAMTREQFNQIVGHEGRSFTVLGTACNHTLDYGEESVGTVLDELAGRGILAIGTNNKPEEQAQGRVMELDGIKVGFLSFTFGLNGKEIPAGKSHIVNVLPLNRAESVDELHLLKAQVDDCRARGCELIVASLHWGLENEFFPTRRQITLAHDIIEAGVDIILGHHPHVIQPVEYYRPRRDPLRTAIICYSLGNLISPFQTPHLTLSLMVRMQLTQGEIAGEKRVYPTDVEIIPVVQMLSGDARRPQVRFTPLREAHGATAQEREYLAATAKYADLVLGEEWRAPEAPYIGKNDSANAARLLR